MRWDGRNSTSIVIIGEPQADPIEVEEDALELLDDKALGMVSEEECSFKQPLKASTSLKHI